MPDITALYAGIIAILFFALSLLVSLARGKTNIVMGHGDDAALRLSIRRFGNLSEYGAMAVLVLLLLELTGHPDRWLHIYGIALVLFRLLHPVVLFAHQDASKGLQAGRFIAAAGTGTLLLAGGIALVLHAL